MEMKDKILHYFRDINYVYNDCTKYETLKSGLEILVQESFNACKRAAFEAVRKSHCDDWVKAEIAASILALSSDEKEGD